MSYTSIMTNDMETCYVCGARADEIHHVFHGPDKRLSEELGLMVPLCRSCHSKVHHVGGEYDRLLKADAQRAYLIKVFGRCLI